MKEGVITFLQMRKEIFFGKYFLDFAYKTLLQHKFQVEINYYET